MIGTGYYTTKFNAFYSGGGAALLLDTYPAQAAYSLRQLKTGVTNVVRVRRSGDNAESDFTATEITDGTLTTWTGANDGFVVTWYDQSGNANNATQSSSSLQPKLVSSGTVLTSANGQSAALADGTDDYLSISLTSSAAGSTWVGVYDRASSGITSQIFGQTGLTFRILEWRTDNKAYFKSGTPGAVSIGSASTSTGSFLDFAYWDNVNINQYRNNSLLGTTAYVGTNSTNNTLFRSGSLYHNGYFQEAIFFSSDESANRTDIQNNINTYYSIY